MDSLFEELIAIDSQHALNFFLVNLRETMGDRRLKDDEVLYVASILAHYSQTSRADTSSIPPMAHLGEVFDHFVLQTDMHRDPGVLEMGGSQVLFFAGFFRDQMARRHNVRWFDQIGQSLYERASHHSVNPKKRDLFDRLSESFPVWTLLCRDLSRTLRDNRLLLRPN